MVFICDAGRLLGMKEGRRRSCSSSSRNRGKRVRLAWGGRGESVGKLDVVVGTVGSVPIPGLLQTCSRAL
jgi:hypothetical protein